MPYPAPWKRSVIATVCLAAGLKLLLVAGAPRGNHSLLPGVLRELVHHVSTPVLFVPKAQLEPDETLVDAAERGAP